MSRDVSLNWTQHWGRFLLAIAFALASSQANSQIGNLEFKASSRVQEGAFVRGGSVNQQVVPKDDFEKFSPYKIPSKEIAVPDKCNDLSQLMLDANRQDLNDYLLKEKFASTCMNDWTARLESATRSGLELSLAKTIGLLIDSSGNPFCMGFRIGPGKIATAKHCFYDRNTGVLFRESQIISFQFPSSVVKYSLSSDLKKSVEPYSASGDMLIVDVPVLKGESMPLISLKNDVAVGEKILLIGVSPQLSSKVKLLSDNYKNGCYIALKDEACFYHNCNAGEGFSGAPIFRPTLDSSGALQVIGVHIEGVGTPGDACQAPILRDYGNTALRISTQ